MSTGLPSERVTGCCDVLSTLAVLFVGSQVLSCSVDRAHTSSHVGIRAPHVDGPSLPGIDPHTRVHRHIAVGALVHNSARRVPRHLLSKRSTPTRSIAGGAFGCAVNGECVRTVRRREAVNCEQETAARCCGRCSSGARSGLLRHSLPTGACARSSSCAQATAAASRRATGSRTTALAHRQAAAVNRNKPSNSEERGSEHAHEQHCAAGQQRATTDHLACVIARVALRHSVIACVNER